MPEEKTNSNNILYGKKTILFPFEPSDLDHFVQLHREDKDGYMQRYCLKEMSEDEAKHYASLLLATGQVKCWSVYVKHNNTRAGFIYLTDFTSFSANISGIMDTKIVKGLLKHIRHGDFTYAEDAIRTLLTYCFNDCGLRRIETGVLSNNKRALALDKKCGFIEEGKLRESFQMDGKFYDTVLLAILKSEFSHE